LKHTIENIFADMHVMNTSFLFYFSSQTFFCLRRSGFVIGVWENGLGARPNFLYAGKALLHIQVHTHRYTQTHTRVETHCIYNLRVITCPVCSEDLEASRSVPECTSAAETLMEGRLRDLLLDIEDRIHQGTLGTLKVHTHTCDHGEPGTAGDLPLTFLSLVPQGMDRQAWRSALQARDDLLMSGRVDLMEVDSPVQLRARDGYSHRCDFMTSKETTILSVFVTSLCLYVSVSLCLYVFVSLYICVFVSLSLFLCIFVFLSLFVSLYLCVFVSVSLCLYLVLSIFVSVSVPLYLFVFLSLSLCLCIFVFCLYLCASVSLCFCLCIFVSFCLCVCISVS